MVHDHEWKTPLLGLFLFALDASDFTVIKLILISLSFYSSLTVAGGSEIKKIHLNDHEFNEEI